MKTRIIKYLFLSLLCLVTVTLVACSKNEPSNQKSGLRIVTSFYPVYALTKAVSGDLNDIKMIQSGAGIHGFEPSASDVAAIYDADMFIYHAHTLESWAGDLAPTLQGSSVQIMEATADMSLDRVKGLEDIEVAKNGDESGLYDPHTWNDPIKAAEEAELIAKTLGQLDPDNALVYQQNAADFKIAAERLVETYQKKFAKVRSRYFVTSHTAFSYLANRFGLEQLGIAGVSTEQEPTSRQLGEIQEFVKTYQVKTIFVEQGVSTKIAETISKATGAEVAELSPLEADPKNSRSYLENLEANLEILLTALHK